MDHNERLSKLAERLDLCAYACRTLVQDVRDKSNVHERASDGTYVRIPIPVVHMALEQDDAIVIVPGHSPELHVSFAWFHTVLSNGTSGELVKLLERAVVLAYSKGTRTLDRQNPDTLRLPVDATKFRKALPRTLPAHHFDAVVSVTLRCPLTGESVSGEAPRKQQAALEERLRRELTQRIYDLENAVLMLAELDAAREHNATPVEPERITLNATACGVAYRMHYATLPQFDVASLYLSQSPMILLHSEA